MLQRFSHQQGSTGTFRQESNEQRFNTDQEGHLFLFFTWDRPHKRKPSVVIES